MGTSTVEGFDWTSSSASAKLEPELGQNASFLPKKLQGQQLIKLINEADPIAFIAA